MSTVYPNATATQLKPGNYTFTITTRNKAGESAPLTVTGVMPRYGPDGCTDVIPSVRGQQPRTACTVLPRTRLSARCSL